VSQLSIFHKLLGPVGSVGVVSSSSIGSFMDRRLLWSTLAFLSILLWVATGPVKAQQLPGANSNQFILRAPAARIQSIAARHGLTIIRRLDGQDVFLVSRSALPLSPLTGLNSSGDNGLLDGISEVQSDADVVHFEHNAAVVTPEVASGINLNGSVVSILDALSDRSLVNYFDDQVWIGYVNQPAIAAIGLSYDAARTGAGIVAIIDTGVDPNHPVLADSLVPGYDFIHDTAGVASEWTDLDGSVVSILDGSVVSILDSGSVVSLNGSTVAILDQGTAGALNSALLPRAFGHGTMVAGLVHLVAPGARIMPLKAFRADGTSTVFDVVRAIYYAVDHGARIINMSFSASASSPEITHAINVATSRGVICIASAGNLGAETLVYPGGLRNVLGVGSTTSTNPPVRSSFSNYGDALVSLGAPGEAVITTYPGGHYAGAWGTSFSAPLAAGGAALLLQLDPTLDQAKAAELLGKADPMQGGMGKGRLNLSEAVRTASDTTAPTISILAPASGGSVFGSVLVSASASDNVGVAGVRFLLDDQPFGAEVTAAPYQQAWMTATVPNGSHVLTALARDGAGNESSSIVNVTVSNDSAAPTVALTNPPAGATLSGTVTVMATASDDLEVFGVRFTVDGVPLGDEDTVAPYEATWTTTAAANGPHVVAAVARDAAGHETSASAAVTVSNDTAPPTITLTNPAGGTTLAGVTTLFASASDDVGVVGVQFKIDGALVGIDTVAPYELLWNTLDAANGIHLVTAVALDGASHETTTSAEVAVLNGPSTPTSTD
jgi:subtilisin family serine protease